MKEVCQTCAGKADISHMFFFLFHCQQPDWGHECIWTVTNVHCALVINTGSNHKVRSCFKRPFKSKVHGIMKELKVIFLSNKRMKERLREFRGEEGRLIDIWNKTQIWTVDRTVNISDRLLSWSCWRFFILIIKSLVCDVSLCFIGLP